MSNSNGVKPITVRVLDAEGKDLGEALLRPTGGNWRVLRGVPSIRVGSRTATCERHGDGWVLQLLPVENKPQSRRSPSW